MNNTKRMREALASKPTGPATAAPPIVAPTVPQKTAPVAQAAPIAQAKAEKPKTESVKYRCDHTEPVKAFLSGDCPTCRGQARREKARQKEEKRRTAAAAAEKAQAIGRLPDGSTFSAIYSAEQQMWTGTLIVNERSFTACASGLQRGLLSELDRLYREAE